MLKWILVAIAVLFIGGCTAIVGGVWWAMSSVKATPEFYEEVAPVELTEEERVETLKEVRDLAVSVVPTIAQNDPAAEGDNSDAPATADSASTPAVSGSPESTETADETDATAPEADTPAEKTVQIKLDERQLNLYIASLMAENRTGKEPFSDPRIQLNDGYARIGLRLTTPDFSGVVSLDIEPRVEGEKSIALIFRRIALGNLAIPLERAMSSAEIQTSDLPEGVTIPKNSVPPRVIYTWDHLEEVGTMIDEASIEGKKLNLKFRVRPLEPAAESAEPPREEQEPPVAEPSAETTQISPRRTFLPQPPRAA